jgi:hypothetical protein
VAFCSSFHEPFHGGAPGLPLECLCVASHPWRSSSWGAQDRLQQLLALARSPGASWVRRRAEPRGRRRPAA